MASGYSDLSEIQKGTRTYGVHQKPPKINLINERPRRESLLDQHLSSAIVRPLPPYNQPESAPYNNSNTQHGSQLYTTVRVTNNTANDLTGSSSGLYPTASTTRYNYVSSGGESYSGHQVGSSRVASGSKPDPVRDEFPDFASLEAELAAKEVALKREIASHNQYNSPWSRPRQIREPRREPQASVRRNDQRWVKECPTPPTSRPTSRASSTRSTTEADLMEKAAKLLQDVEEMEKKPLNEQQIVIEGGIRKPESVNSARVGPSSVHTAIITVPRREINNKSPLPFSYDNFSTLGVRGNIASVGAAEPDKPYPPIFPTIKRTPSPMDRR